MITEHLRLLLDTVQDAQLLFKLVEQLSRAETPTTIVNSVRLGRLTAQRKPSGGVRGIVAGDMMRRLVGHTMAQQLSDVVKAATAPLQYALSTRAGHGVCGPCIAVTDRGEPTHDGDGDVNRRDWAFDLISRKAMLQALMRIEGGPAVMPCVRMFYGQASTYLWEDDEGVRRVGAQNFALFFFLLPPKIALFVLVWWGSKPPGLHMTARELQTCILEGAGLQKDHPNSTRRRPERAQRVKLWAGGGGNKERNFGRSGGHPGRAPKSWTHPRKF